VTNEAATACLTDSLDVHTCIRTKYFRTLQRHYRAHPSICTYVIRQFIKQRKRQVALKPHYRVNRKCQSYAVLNKKVFNCFLEMAKEPADVIEVGRLFHRRGPATAKDRSPVAVLDRGTNRRRELADRRSRWQLQTMVAGCNPQGNRPSCRERTLCHDGHLKSYTLLDWEPVSFTLQWYYIIKHSGARDKPDSSILYGLQRGRPVNIALQ